MHSIHIHTCCIYADMQGHIRRRNVCAQNPDKILIPYSCTTGIIIIIIIISYNIKHNTKDEGVRGTVDWRMQI